MSVFGLADADAMERQVRSRSREGTRGPKYLLLENGRDQAWCLSQVLLKSLGIIQYSIAQCQVGRGTDEQCDKQYGPHVWHI